MHGAERHRRRALTGLRLRRDVIATPSPDDDAAAFAIGSANKTFRATLAAYAALNARGAALLNRGEVLGIPLHQI